MDNIQKHQRRSIRLSGYDYQSAGAYFVTLCTQNRLCLFGDIANGEMILNDSGHMVHRIWNELPLFYPGADIDAFQIMPNHFHGIVILVGEHTGVWQPQRVAPTKGPSPGNKDWKHNSRRGRCLPWPRATTGGCPYGSGWGTGKWVIVAGCGPSVQNHDHQKIYGWGETIRMALFPRETVAAKLFRKGYPRYR